ncbi:hypothetical protein HWI92_18505 [Dyadobacter sandarakinus]|uniref:Outer membrane protein beta-barrel domain-containing protein n=2 Tax=Dyadobacter sandarakinus TaxID=2747268 RepID=A0ABX7IDN5_9BACT|nr:hypothetical protein HWI92_18505 [Dyadobacter sandarakinus]
MVRLLLTLVLYFFLHRINAQAPSARRWSSNGISGLKSYNRKEKQPNFLVLRAGLTQFYGELYEQDMHGMAGVGAGRWVNKNWALKFEYTAGKLGGQEASFFNTYFINTYNTFELHAQWDLTRQFSHFEPGDLHLNAYAGLGLMIFNANAFDLTDGRMLRFTGSKLSARNPLFLRWGKPRGAPGIRNTHEGILPLGICSEYHFLNHWKLIFDFRFYFIRTDKADATSGMRLSNPEESESYSDTPNDKFSYISAGLGFQF